MFLQKIEDWRDQPAGVSKFDNRSQIVFSSVRLERIEKDFKALHVHFESRRQLEKDRPEALSQIFCARKEKCQGLFRILEPFEVREEATRFHCENKIERNARAPVPECLFTGQAVEAVVDLHGIEMPDEEFQPL